MATQIVTGIDIGHVNLSAVSVRRRGNEVRLIKQATVSRYGSNGAKKPLSMALAELAQHCPFKGRVIVAASEVPVLVRFIPTIPMAADRMERLLRLELSQHASEDGDLAADHFVVPLLSGDEIIQCCCIGQVDAMRHLLSELSAADLRPDQVQAPAIGLGNTLSLEPPNDDIGEDDHYGLVIDIGAKTTRVVLRRGTQMLAAREVASGGDAFTEALAQAREMSFEQAEQLKRQAAHLLHTAESDASVSHSQSRPIADALTTKPAASDTHSSAGEASDEGLDWLQWDDDEQAEPANQPSDADESNGNAADSPDALFAPSESDDQAPSSAASAPSTPTSAANPPSTDQHLLLPSNEEPLATDLNAPEMDVAPAAAPAEPALWQRPDGPANNPPADLHDPGSSTVLIGRSELGPELSRAAEALAGQISASLAWFRAQLKVGTITIHDIRLCGGGSQLAGLAGYLSRRLRAPVTPWNPASRMWPEAEQVPTLALGLALSGLRDCPDLDLRPESLRYRQQWRRQILPLWISAALLVLTAVVFLVNHWQDRSHYHQEIARLEQHRQQFEAASSDLTALRERRDDLATDVRGIAARIFAGRDLLYVIRALKQAAEVHQDLWVAEFRTESVAGEDEERSAPNTGRGTRGTRGTRGATLPSRAATARRDSPHHSDTSIDRGKIFVRIVIRRDAQRDAQASERIFRDWLMGVMNWRRPDNNLPLFQDYEQTEVPSVSDQYEYEVRFDFLPTSLQHGEAQP